MKKIISIVLAVSIAMSMCVFSLASNDLLGDVNEDGNVTAVDARLILQVVAGILEETEQIKVDGDVNNDGKITAVDARVVLQVVAGIISAPEKPSGPDAPGEPCKHIDTTEQVIKAPTCTEDGLVKIICNGCGEIREAPLAAYGHDFGQYAFEPETCTKDGIRYMICDNCGIEIEEVIPATGHTFENDVCVNCGYDDYKRKLEEYKEYEKIINGKIAEIRAQGPVYTGTDEQFNNEVSNLTAKIRELDRKIASLSGDTSSSGKAQLARAKAERDSLQKELDELYAAKSRASQIEALEAELEYYEDRLFT